MEDKIRVQNLFKIFGKNPQEALEKYQSGTSAEQLFKESGHVVAVADVSFSVAPGEMFMVMGLSGSGKSTLVRCLNRLLDATSGSVFVDDEDIQKVDGERLREIRRKKMAMVFQHFGLFPHRTVLGNAEYGLKVQGIEEEVQREKALKALELVGLKEWADRPLSNLSGGMQQRVGLARALATEADILLMDEAFSALDPLIRRDMQDELINLQREMQKTIVFITHDLNEALKLGDRIAVMKGGEIVQIGTPEDIVSNPENDYVANFTQDINRSLVLTASSIMEAPEPLFLKRDTVRTAMVRMRSIDRDEIYVVNSQRQPVGIITDKDIAAALKKKINDLSEVMNTDFPQTTESTSLGDILPLCTAGLPIAVVNENGRLRGILDPLDCLNNITPNTYDNGESSSVEEPAKTEEEKALPVKDAPVDGATEKSANEEPGSGA
jgi:glycine betaine/proline transport system ATP-binding protein